MDTLYTFGDNMTDYKTKSVHFLGLMNSATEGEFGPSLGYGWGCLVFFWWLVSRGSVSLAGV